MQRDDEREVEGFVCRLGVDDLVPAQPGRQKHGVPEARDREQFRDALQDANDDRLEVAHTRLPESLPM